MPQLFHKSENTVYLQLIMAPVILASALLALLRGLRRRAGVGRGALGKIANSARAGDVERHLLKPLALQENVPRLLFVSTDHSARGENAGICRIRVICCVFVIAIHCGKVFQWNTSTSGSEAGLVG